VTIDYCDVTVCMHDSLGLYASVPKQHLNRFSRVCSIGGGTGGQEGHIPPFLNMGAINVMCGLACASIFKTVPPPMLCRAYPCGHQTDRHTHTHTQTTLRATSVAISRMKCGLLRPNNIFKMFILLKWRSAYRLNLNIDNAIAANRFDQSPHKIIL